MTTEKDAEIVRKKKLCIIKGSILVQNGRVLLGSLHVSISGYLWNERARLASWTTLEQEINSLLSWSQKLGRLSEQEIQA